MTAAGQLRRTDTADAAAYRVMRVGAWLHMTALPPAPGGKSQVPPPPDPLRDQLQLMAQNSKWAAVLEETESALSRYRLWLDLHRMSAQALGALGPTHAAARQAVVRETANLLARFPDLVDMSFASGAPMADGQTRAWLDAEVTAAPTRNPRTAAPAGEPEEDLESHARGPGRRRQAGRRGGLSARACRLGSHRQASISCPHCARVCAFRVWPAWRRPRHLRGSRHRPGRPRPRIVGPAPGRQVPRRLPALSARAQKSAFDRTKRIANGIR